ncbi:gene transfer agent family protein [Sphingomonas sp. PB4P5]|uniref:gene transfer agent family protein n=1 Tax=Parasphingomonas puruogangriensis TaxID=3096155 RepID=UPI002FCC2FFD
MNLPVPQTWIDLEFADGVYTFKLGLKQIAELQTKVGCGIGALNARVLRGRYLLDGVAIGLHNEAEYKYEDLTETIRLGLIGGGAGEVNEQPVAVTSIVANRLVDNYVHGWPMEEAWKLAATILDVCIRGYSPKKKADPIKDVTADETSGSITPEPLPIAP